MVEVLHCKHNVDKYSRYLCTTIFDVNVKLRKMPSDYNTPPFDREISLEFDINLLQQFKN